MRLDYGMWDADNHLYEALDAFTRHLPDARRRDVSWITDERGHRKLVMDGRVWQYIPNPTFDPVAVPGALDRRKVEPLTNHPEYRDRDQRLATFDSQGIEASVMFPTLASGLEEFVGHNLDLLNDVLWAFNRWLSEDWGFSYRNRIFATPLISLASPQEAERMLDWAIGEGARAVMLASGPVRTAMGYRSPADPMFDGFWARCAAAHVVVCAHVAASGYQRYSGDYTGHYEWRPFEDQMVDRVMNHGRAISDFFTAMVWHGALSRHPDLRIVSVENRSDWVARLLELFKHYWRPGMLAEDPIDVFVRSVLVTPHWDDDLGALRQHLPATNIVAGSDWPHYDALPEPTDFAKYLGDFDAPQVRRIMRDNLRSLLVA